VRVIGSEPLRAFPDGKGAIEMSSHGEEQARASDSPGLLGHLEPDALAADGIVLLNHAFLLEAEDLVEVRTP
jgi:hypothetical protein